MTESLPVEAFLDGYPAPHRVTAERLRSIVRATVPEAIERVRPGWRLVGYDVPVGRRTAFFAWVFPEQEHVHLGFPGGMLLDDPDGVLIGAGITKRARWLTYAPGADVDERVARDFVQAAAAAAAIPRSALG
jgi:hypothetical protein